MSKQLLIAVALCSSLLAPATIARAQQPESAQGRIIGVVAGDNGMLPSAEVQLRTPKDSTLTATLTGVDGRFVIAHVKFGTYTVHVSFLGYKDCRLTDIEISQAQPLADLGMLKLQRVMIALLISRSLN